MRAVVFAVLLCALAATACDRVGNFRVEPARIHDDICASQTC